MSTYPGGIATFPAVSSGNKLNSPNHITQHTLEEAEIIAIETALGVNPQGSAADVKTRIANTEAVANAALPNSMSTGKLLGRGTAGTGAVEAITLGTNLSISGTTLNATGGGGANVTRGTFTNASLSSGILTITHSLALSAPYPVIVTIFNNSSQQIIPDQVTGLTNTCIIDLTSYGALSGTWGYAIVAG